MQRWMGSAVPVSKGGSREPSQHPNQDRKADQQGQRQLVVIQGGDPQSVTHRAAPRRGSRPRFRDTKGDAMAKVLQGEITDYRQGSQGSNNDGDQEVQADDRQSGEVVSEPLRAVDELIEEPPHAAPTPGVSSPRPHMWSDADFTPEAIAAYDREIASRPQPSVAEQTLLRKDLEKAADRFQRGRFKKPPKSKPPKAPTEFEKKGACVSQVDLRDQADKDSDAAIPIKIRSLKIPSSHSSGNARK